MLEYLGLPYSDKSEEVMDWRADVSDFIFSELSKEGRNIYAPISSAHHVAKKYGMPRNWEFWEGLDKEILSICGKFIIVMLDGWKYSVGLRAEFDIADELGLEIEYLDPTPYIQKMELIRSGIWKHK